MASVDSERKRGRTPLAAATTRGNGRCRRSKEMNGKVWFARFLFYFLIAVRGYAPEGRKPKAASVQRPQPAPIVQLKPATQAK